MKLPKINIQNSTAIHLIKNNENLKMDRNVILIKLAHSSLINQLYSSSRAYIIQEICKKNILTLLQAMYYTHSFIPVEMPEATKIQKIDLV